MSLTPEQLLEWAEKVEHAVIHDEVAALIDAFEKIRNPVTFAPLTPVPLYVDCGCPKYGICMSTACPRAMKITSELNA